jgi:hypothetical protein
MNRLRRSACLTAVLGTLAAGCVAGDPTLSILYNTMPGAECSVSATGTSQLPDGWLDLAPPEEEPLRGYTFTPVVRNSASAVSGSPNLRSVQLGGADTELLAGPTSRSADLVSGLGNAGQRSVLFSGLVQPNSGQAGLRYLVIDNEQAALLAGALAENEEVQLLARTRVFGKMDGSEIVSPWYDYPITLCKGCLEEPGPCGWQR